MVYQQINNDRKEQTLYLLLEEGWEIERVAHALGVSMQSIEWWEENYAVHGCIKPFKPTRGHPRLLTGNMIDDIQQLLCEDPSLLLDEIKEWLALYHYQPISTTALHLNLQDLALTHKHLKRVAAKRDDAYHMEWILSMTMNYTADQLMFLDESSKDKCVVLRRYGCAPSGQEAIHHVSLNCGVRHSILLALSLNGYMAVRVIEGSIDGAEFYDFVVNDVVSPLYVLDGHGHIFLP